MSTTSKISNNPVVLAVLSACISAMPLQSARAAPGELPTNPLFLSNSVEPNLFLTLDNSASMTMDTTMRQIRIDGVRVDVNGQIRYHNNGPRKRTFDLRDLYFNRIEKIFPPANGTNAEWDKYWVARNVDANPMYYDPTRIYLPWPGFNADGSPMYENANPRAVKADPSSGQRYDLTVTHTFTFDGITTEWYVPTYFNWTDTDNDGIIDVSDQHERVEIAPGTAEMQNFANWYQYHRSRIQTAKYVAGDLIVKAGSVRMGRQHVQPQHIQGSRLDVGSRQEARVAGNTLYRQYSRGYPGTVRAGAHWRLLFPRRR